MSLELDLDGPHWLARQNKDVPHERQIPWIDPPDGADGDGIDFDDPPSDAEPPKAQTYAAKVVERVAAQPEPQE